MSKIRNATNPRANGHVSRIPGQVEARASSDRWLPPRPTRMALDRPSRNERSPSGPAQHKAPQSSNPATRTSGQRNCMGREQTACAQADINHPQHPRRCRAPHVPASPQQPEPPKVTTHRRNTPRAAARASRRRRWNFTHVALHFPLIPAARRRLRFLSSASYACSHCRQRLRSAPSKRPAGLRVHSASAPHMPAISRPTSKDEA